jgi:hypothetical protein
MALELDDGRRLKWTDGPACEDEFINPGRA